MSEKESIDKLVLDSKQIAEKTNSIKEANLVHKELIYIIKSISIVFLIMLFGLLIIYIM